MVEPRVLTIFVPASALIAAHIAPESAIVGTRIDDRILIDYAGNLNGAVNLITFEERLQSAAGRHDQKYPTSARMAVKPDDVKAVGMVRHSPALKAWIVDRLDDEAALKAWLNGATVRVGGGQEIWNRAIGLTASRFTSSDHVAAQTRHRGDLKLAAIAKILDAEPGLSGLQPA